MAQVYGEKIGPVVSVLIPTFNRPRYLSQALASVLQQTYRNLQIIVVNDGGEDVSDVIDSFDDPRIRFIHRKENRGKAFSLNQALAEATGKYIAYLDDDDVYYPHHIETLVNALENQTSCQVAYSDLYKVCCNLMPDGSRQVLSKVVEVSRDFDRYVMLYFNHVLHVSLMHHRDLIDKTGPYNENLNVLIDWDMTRRLAFFSDFHHVHEITGEYYNPIHPCDRVSVQRRKDQQAYLRSVLTIRTTRPAKPWPKLQDLSVILVTQRLDEQVFRTITAIYRHSFYPYEIYLPLEQNDLMRLRVNIANLVTVPVDSLASETRRMDAAIARSAGDYIAVVPSGFPIRKFWLEDSLYALINSSANREAFELEDSSDKLWAVVTKRNNLNFARQNLSHPTVRRQLAAAGISIRRVTPEQIPFQFDQLLEQARQAENNGDWTAAARMFEYLADHYENRLWMKSLAARAFFHAGNHTTAEQISHLLNQHRPTVDTLLLEAKIKRQKKDFESAIKLLEKAQQILGEKELLWI